MAIKVTTEQKWHRQAENAKREAQQLSPGPERDALLRKASQLESASHINQWLSSSELRSPT